MDSVQLAAVGEVVAARPECPSSIGAYLQAARKIPVLTRGGDGGTKEFGARTKSFRADASTRRGNREHLAIRRDAGRIQVVGIRQRALIGGGGWRQNLIARQDQLEAGAIDLKELPVRDRKST